MKQAVLILALFIISPFVSAETRTYTKTSPMTAQVVIKTQSKDPIQASAYIDGRENKRFIDEMLADPSSTLAIAKREIEIENCGEESNQKNDNLNDCGRVLATDFVQTSFGRGSWMDGGASYSFFLGFQSVGSGRFFEASRLVQIREEVSAHVDENLKYQGAMTKSLSFENIEVITGH